MERNLDLTPDEWAMLRHLVIKGYGLLIIDSEQLQDVRLKALCDEEISMATSLVAKLREIQT